jgi:hypothetical protein
MIEVGRILSGLIQRTTEGKLKWTRAVLNDRFAASVDAISIVIWEVADPSYTLEILNESGETVETLDYRNSTEAQDQQLARLYLLARRSALDTDSTLEKLAKGLEL